MIHLLWSVFFLVAGIALVLFYLFVFALICLFLFTFWHFYKEYRNTGFAYNAGVETREWLGHNLPIWFRSKAFLSAILLIVLFNTSLYLKERVEWMGEKNGNLTAKEYWVAGQVVYAYRNIFCLFNHPDDWFIQPFTWLQEWIYRKGSHYLRENDGEIGVWTNVWFVYPYSRKFYLTKDFRWKTPSPRMMALVERTWFSVEKQATGDWADSQMKEQHYYRGFPGLAFYYTAFQFFLTGQKVGSRVLLVNDAHLLGRIRNLVDWLGELQEKWQTSPETKLFIEEHPKIKAFLQLSRVDGTSNLIYGSILNHEFSCMSREVQEYMVFRSELVGSKSILPRIKDQAQAQRLYNIAVNTMIGRFQSYTLERFCGLAVAGKEDMRRFTGWAKPVKEERESTLRNLFKEAVQILEEEEHER